jgi:hypothetical protein
MAKLYYKEGTDWLPIFTLLVIVGGSFYFGTFFGVVFHNELSPPLTVRVAIKFNLVSDENKGIALPENCCENWALNWNAEPLVPSNANVYWSTIPLREIPDCSSVSDWDNIACKHEWKVI